MPDTDAPYDRLNGELCTNGPHPVCGDYNAMPQRMWRTDRQTWRCEGCGVMMQRHFTGGHWTPWEPIS